jgi:hypothetical protein
MRAFLLRVQLLLAFLERTLTYYLPFPLLQHGVSEDMIIGDFYARHTTTNLRNVCMSVCLSVCLPACACVMHAVAQPSPSFNLFSGRSLHARIQPHARSHNHQLHARSISRLPLPLRYSTHRILPRFLFYRMSLTRVHRHAREGHRRRRFLLSLHAGAGLQRRPPVPTRRCRLHSCAALALHAALVCGDFAALTCRIDAASVPHPSSRSCRSPTEYPSSRRTQCGQEEQMPATLEAGAGGTSASFCTSVVYLSWLRWGGWQGCVVWPCKNKADVWLCLRHMLVLIQI